MEGDFKSATDKALRDVDSITPELSFDKYNISTTTYPSDLGGPDLKHFVLFNINVRGKSKFKKDNADKILGVVRRDSSSPQLSQEALSGKTLSNTAGVAAGVATGVAVTALTSKIAKSIGKTGSTAQVVTKAVGGLAGAVAGIAAANSPLLQPDTLERITDAIALHLEAPPSVKYSMNYSNKDLGTLVGLLGSISSSKEGLGGEAAAALGMASAKIPGMFGLTGDLSAALGSSAGVALNPFKETVFESVDFRSFGFKYRFMPKNQRESLNVRNIIETFKYHMHPEVSDNKLFFIYPSVFDITYYFNSTINDYFHRFRPCVLESMDVTYGGEQFSSFRDGNPTEVNMSLVFREVELLTKESITKGY